MTELYEDNQRDLERAVENLSFLLEQPIDVTLLDKLRQDITNESVRPVLIRDVTGNPKLTLPGIRAEAPRHTPR